MTRFSDTQLIVLSAAAQRDNHLALPLPPNLKGGAAHKVIKPLIEKGLLDEIERLHPGLERPRATNELVRRVITRFVEDVLAESQRRLRALGLVPAALGPPGRGDGHGPDDEAGRPAEHRRERGVHEVRVRGARTPPGARRAR